MSILILGLLACLAAALIHDRPISNPRPPRYDPLPLLLLDDMENDS
jgi:hypothetical protein